MSDAYTIPAPLAAALGSGRGSLFTTLFNNEIDKGHVVPVDQVKEIIRLVGDLIDDNHKLKTAIQRMNDIKDYMADLEVELEGITEKLQEARTEIKEEINDWVSE